MTHHLGITWISILISVISMCQVLMSSPLIKMTHYLPVSLILYISCFSFCSDYYYLWVAGSGGEYRGSSSSLLDSFRDLLLLKVFEFWLVLLFWNIVSKEAYVYFVTYLSRREVTCWWWEGRLLWWNAPASSGRGNLPSHHRQVKTRLERKVPKKTYSVLETVLQESKSCQNSKDLSKRKCWNE